MNRCGCRDQGVANLDVVAAVIVCQVLAGLTPNPVINGKTHECAKKTGQGFVFVRSRPMPHLDDRDRRTSDGLSGTAQFFPDR